MEVFTMLKNFYPVIDSQEMRRCAIDYQWFTCGDNEDYEKWLDLGGWEGHKVTPAWLYKAARMAMNYSDLEELGYIGEDSEDIIDNFSAILLNYSTIKYSRQGGSK